MKTKLITYRQIGNLNERYRLDRRRIEDAYYQYALLRICSWYPNTFELNKLSFHHKVGDAILHIINLYHSAFMEKYSGKCMVLFIWLMHTDVI